MSTTPLTDAERDAIAADIAAGMARNEIARKHGRSAGTVTKIAQDRGLTFDRSAVKSACEAKQADNRARLASLQSDIIDDAIRLRQQLWKPCVELKPMVVSGGMHAPAHVEIVKVKRQQPTFADQQKIATSVAICVDKAIAIDRHSDGGDGMRSDLDRFLAHLIGPEALAGAGAS